MDKKIIDIKDSLSFKIIGCCMKVQGILGGGMKEINYQKALAIEFNNQKVKFAQEFSLNIYYEKIKIGSKRVDFFIEDKLILEIKAVPLLNTFHFSQTMSYCKAFNKQYGLLINFGGRNLEYKRVYNTSFKN